MANLKINQSALIYQSTDIPRPTNLPIYQPTNLPTYQSTNLPIYQSTNLPTYQSTNLPIYQPTNLPIYQPTNLPISPIPEWSSKCLQSKSAAGSSATATQPI
ncbi:MAG: hypothetical protein ABIG63_17825 [Chloroflexota bacterium]